MFTTLRSKTPTGARYSAVAALTFSAFTFSTLLTACDPGDSPFADPTITVDDDRPTTGGDDGPSTVTAKPADHRTGDAVLSFIKDTVAKLNGQSAPPAGEQGESPDAIGDAPGDTPDQEPPFCAAFAAAAGETDDEAEAAELLSIHEECLAWFAQDPCAHVFADVDPFADFEDEAVLDELEALYDAYDACLIELDPCIVIFEGVDGSTPQDEIDALYAEYLDCSGQGPEPTDPCEAIALEIEAAFEAGASDEELEELFAEYDLCWYEQDPCLHIYDAAFGPDGELLELTDEEWLALDEAYLECIGYEPYEDPCEEIALAIDEAYMNGASDEELEDLYLAYEQCWYEQDPCLHVYDPAIGPDGELLELTEEEWLALDEAYLECIGYEPNEDPCEEIAIAIDDAYQNGASDEELEDLYLAYEQCWYAEDPCLHVYDEAFGPDGDLLELTEEEWMALDEAYFDCIGYEPYEDPCSDLLDAAYEQDDPDAQLALFEAYDHCLVDEFGHPCDHLWVQAVYETDPEIADLLFGEYEQCIEDEFGPLPEPEPFPAECEDILTAIDTSWETATDDELNTLFYELDLCMAQSTEDPCDDLLIEAIYADDAATADELFAEYDVCIGDFVDGPGVDEPAAPPPGG